MSVVLYLGLIEGLQPGNEKYPGKTDKISKNLKKVQEHSPRAVGAGQFFIHFQHLPWHLII